MAERPGLWDNIHAKRKRIAAGSGEKMRKPGTKGAPTAKALQESKIKEAFVLGFAQTLEAFLTSPSMVLGDH